MKRKSSKSENTRALVVEDDASFATFVTRALEKDGISSLHASDGVEAISIVRREDFELIVLDLQMPGMNGWEFMRHLRQEARNDARILVISGRDEDETEAFARRLGAEAYLRKPVRAGEVVEAARALLAN